MAESSAKKAVQATRIFETPANIEKIVSVFRFLITREDMRFLRNKVLDVLKRNDVVKDKERFADFLINFLVATGKGEEFRFVHFDTITRMPDSNIPDSFRIYFSHDATVLEPKRKMAGGVVYNKGVYFFIAHDGFYNGEGTRIYDFRDMAAHPPILPAEITELTGINVLTIAPGDFGARGKQEGPRT